LRALLSLGCCQIAYRELRRGRLADRGSGVRWATTKGLASPKLGI
jgi:hypothetical protein